MIRLINYILQNKFLFSILLLYAVLMLSVIDWGIPNKDHPFVYNMDEWHQLQSVKTTFKYLSPNVPGSAHGTMFHFILSGMYLAPFFLLGVINPFLITSPLVSLEAQQGLFEILRLNTLIFGLLSVFFLAKIAKNYFKLNPIITVVLFTFTPLWLALSNYFKYDIALVFWIILSLYFMLKFGSTPNFKNYLIAGVFCSLAVATKISALPLLIIYVFSFFWFNKKLKLRTLLAGLLIFFIMFILLGIPDLLLGKGNWSEFLHSNLISGSSGFGNILTGFNTWWQYLFFKILPIDFGYGFFFIYILGISYWIIYFFKSLLNGSLFLFKKEFFLLFCLLLFILSLMPLKLGANGNRLLVLLPFLSLLSGLFLQKAKGIIMSHKFIFGSFLMLILAVQIFQSMIIGYVKWVPDVRQTFSQWMKKNIKENTLIGIENIPIYQLLPDIVVKDFYSKNIIYDYKASFNYQIIDSSSKTIPSVVIVTNKELESYYFKKSPKKELIRRLVKEGYNEVIEFRPSQMLYLFSGNALNHFISGLDPIPTISLFKKL